MAKQLEHNIRDWLVDNPDFIDNGLHVINKEHYLPNHIGSNGFKFLKNISMIIVRNLILTLLAD